MVSCHRNSFYVAPDHLGAPHQITNAAQQVVWLWDHDPFGNGAPAAVGGFTYNLRFPGQYADAETGLNYNYFRDYNPRFGRYMQSDPIGLAGGINTYAYAGGNPVSLVDPDGTTIGGAIIGGRIGSWAGGALGGALGELIDPLGGGIPGAGLGSSLGGLAGRAFGDWASNQWANDKADKGANADKKPDSNSDGKNCGSDNSNGQKDSPGKDIKDPNNWNGCEACARQNQERVGGDIVRITPDDGAPALGGYRGTNPGWSYHDVVVSNGRVYDAFTGPGGASISDYKALWQYPNAIKFGF